MARLILAFILAPVVWGVVMFGGTLLIRLVYADVGDTGPFPISYLLMALVGSVIYSLVAGFTGAAVAGGDATRAGLVAGVALLLVGLGVQISSWDLLPVWYHLVFLALLIPATVVGAHLKGGNSAGAAQ